MIIKLSTKLLITLNSLSWLNGFPLHNVSSRNSWWQPKRGASISERIHDCFLLIWEEESILKLSFCFFCRFVSLFYPSSHLFPVISSFQDVSSWKLRRIVRDLPQAQKRNSYKHHSFKFSAKKNLRISFLCLPQILRNFLRFPPDDILK